MNIKTSNPLFKTVRESSEEFVATNTNSATYGGITLKTVFGLILAVVAALITGFVFNRWAYQAMGDVEAARQLAIRLSIIAVVTGIVGFIAVIVGRLSSKAAKFCLPIYAVAEGAALGTICSIVEIYYQGVTAIALAGTLVVFGVELALFATGVIRNHSKVYAVALAWLITLVLVSLVGVVLYFVLPANVKSSIFSNFWVLLAIEIAYTLYACIVLMLDFFECSEIVKQGFDKDYEWVTAIGLLVSIFFIFIQILRIALLIMEKSDN